MAPSQETVELLAEAIHNNYWADEFSNASEVEKAGAKQQARAAYTIIYEREIARKDEALKFYADNENWKWTAKPTDTDYILDCGSEVQRDFGKRAKQALAPHEEKTS